MRTSKGILNKGDDANTSIALVGAAGCGGVRRTWMENRMHPEKEGFCPIEEAIDELRQGRMIVLVDDEHRENEGDLVIAAEKATAGTLNFMLTHGRGILCLAMSSDICDRLPLDPQTSVNTTRMGTAF